MNRGRVTGRAWVVPDWPTGVPDPLGHLRVNEFEKFAPQLNVVIFHSGSSSSQRDKIVNGKVDLSQVDVLLTTPGSALTPWLREVASFTAPLLTRHMNPWAMLPML